MTAALLLSLVSVAFGSELHNQATASHNVADARVHKTCVAGTSRTTQAQFDRLVGFEVDCADVYDDAAPTWAAWDTPWFTDNPLPADNWTSFAARASNQMTITLSLIPDSVLGTDWRAAGAAGDYVRYAKTLARNLIKDHMGNSVIRLAAEANGTWEKDEIGNTPSQWAQWVQFWRQTVLAMRSVSGAHFSFDWCISSGYRDIPFQDYYPGNDVVDSIGVDVYDLAPAGTSNRFEYVNDEPGGLAAIAAFSHEQGKPLTIPEWGLDPTSAGGDGDDPAFVSGIAKFVASTPVSSESYFFGLGPGTTLASAPMSLKIYKTDFSQSSGSVIDKQ